MNHNMLIITGAIWAGAVLAATTSNAAEPSRQYDMTWAIQIEQVPEGAHEARAWIAIPQELPEQRVSGLEVTTPHTWQVVEDSTFHSKAVMVVIPNPAAPISIGLRAKVVRDPVLSPRAATLTAAERDLYLRQEALVSLSPRMRALADSIGGTDRARYDFVLGRMVYDKTVPGWGRGDSERACDVGKGNCTDFHSLFMSLSRAKGVPAVFEMGYSTLPDGEVEHIGGYHCWAWFYSGASKAWIPVDISEADKHPEKTEFFYGHLDADRITFSRGRQITLPNMQGEPLNYLPSSAYVEVDGKPLAEGVSRKLTYRTEPAPAADAAKE